MSRIAGIISSIPLDVNRLASEMKAGITSNIGWKGEIVNVGKYGAFIWSGWRAPEISRYGAIVVAIDGIFYNRSEIDLLLDIKINCRDAFRFTQLYRKYGFEGALQQINGDFSITLFNEDTAELFLARDRFGVKPLYFVNFSNYFAFASRPRALFCVPKVTKELNKRFVAIFGGAHYRYIDNVPNESPYEKIKQLPAAHFLRLFNGMINVQPYWNLSDQQNLIKDQDTLAAMYQNLLVDSVERRINAVAGKSAFTLSGGLDSSSVLSCAVKITGQKQTAFSSVYPDKTYDETEEIKSMLESKVRIWNPVEINIPDICSLIDSMVLDHDEPVATATWLSHYLLCGVVSSDGFNNIFGGLGGDELNAGEYEHFFFHFADLKYSGKKNQYLLEIEKWAEHHNHPIYQKNRSIAEEYLEKKVDITKAGICIPYIYKNSRYLNTINKEYFDLYEYKPVMDHPFRSYLKNRTYQDIFRETAPCCLRAEDRQTTKFNIDHIDPFFDHRLAEFMFRIPGELKINGGVTKVLLRKAMRGILPEETRNRVAKTGWNAPAHLWFATKKSSEAIGDLINSSFFINLNIYNTKTVNNLFDEHLKIVKSNKNTENHMMFFWQLLNLTSWIKSIK